MTFVITLGLTHGVYICLYWIDIIRCVIRLMVLGVIELQTNRRRQLLEPIIVVGLFVTSAMILPLFFPCTQTDCVIEQVGWPRNE